MYRQCMSQTMLPYNLSVVLRHTDSFSDSELEDFIVRTVYVLIEGYRPLEMYDFQTQAGSADSLCFAGTITTNVYEFNICQTCHTLR